MPTKALNLCHPEGGNQFIARDNRSRIAELLISVNDARKINSGVGMIEQLLEGLLLNNYRKSWWCDQVSKPPSLSHLNFMVLRVDGKSSRGELADFLPANKVRLGGGEDDLNQLGIHSHRASLERALKQGVAD